MYQIYVISLLSLVPSLEELSCRLSMATYRAATCVKQRERGGEKGGKEGREGEIGREGGRETWREGEGERETEGEKNRGGRDREIEIEKD